MATALTFYFAWVSPDDKTFDPSFARFDENPFSIEIEGKEGNIPTMTVEIKNPRIGPLAPGRQVWAWLSMSADGSHTVIPLFHGRLIGIPKSINENLVSFQFVARAKDYIYQKQQVAETLKRLPEYDPIFFDILKRDDPDAILEGWCGFYAVDRVTNAVSYTDLLIGEDGTINLGGNVFYDSVDVSLQQSPLVAVNIKAQVSWRQQYTGFFKVGTWAYPTLGSEPFVNDWPRSGAKIGGGYSAAISWAAVVDPFLGIQSSSNASGTYNWQNTEKSHRFGDPMSISASYSTPTQPMMMYTTIFENHIGTLDPYAVDNDGNPAPINEPAWQRLEQVGVRKFALDYAGKTASATLGLRYDADRQRYERIDMTIQADVQSILVDPQVTEDTENITLKSGDLGVPVTNFLNWSSIAGTHVDVGTVIFPDNPLVPGQTSSQICVGSGTAGLVEPEFSNVAGHTTIDGGVTWSSLGDTPPADTMQDWQSMARVAVGTLVVPRPISGAPDVDALTVLGNLGLNSRGTPTAKYTIYAEGQGGPGDTMIECTNAGIFAAPSLSHVLSQIDTAPLGVAGAIIVSEINLSPSNEAQFLKFVNPSGKSIFIAVQAGETGEFHTTFDETPGATTVDGSVIWLCIGPVSLPIGGSPGMTPAASYFPSDRGQQSLQHLICRARARLRRRARAVQIAFDCPFELVAPTISNRTNIAFTDPRMPGRVVAGKVISYKLRRNGDAQETVASVVIGCSIGNGGGSPSLTESPGAATYVDDYFDPGVYQVWSGQVISLTNNPDDIGYSPPVQQPVDDGVSFPVYGVGDVIVTNQWHGVASTINQANIEAYNAQIDGAISDMIASAKATHSATWNASTGSPDSSGSTSFTAPVTNYGALAAGLASRLASIVGQGTSLWYEFTLKNLTAGPYSQTYVVSTTKLNIPMTIDLSATSTGG